MEQKTYFEHYAIEGGKERILKVKPKGGECRNKLRKHLIFFVLEFKLLFITFSELVSTSPPFGTAGRRREQAPTAARMRRQQSLLSVTLSPARERKLHLVSEDKKNTS